MEGFFFFFQSLSKTQFPLTVIQSVKRRKQRPVLRDSPALGVSSAWESQEGQF